MSWTPLLTKDAAEPVWKTIGEIADALREAAAGEGLRERDGGPSARLSDGDAGISLFFAYLAEASGDEGAAELADFYLERALAALQRGALAPGLFDGFTGVAWVAEHLQGMIFERDDENLNQPVDDALLGLLQTPAGLGGYDLINGLAGLGIYALETLPRSSGHECLELVTRRLLEISEAAGPGRRWLTPPERLPPRQLAQCPAGHFNLGVAHGVPGVIGLLGAARQLGAASPAMRDLLAEAVAWLLTQSRGDGAEWHFSNWDAPGAPAERSRLAWCYGDPGIAATLLLAGRAASEPAWERKALDIARTAAVRSPSTSEVRDASLCHGAAGLGHLFHRLYRTTGDELLAEAARSWFERTLLLRRPGEGLGGYLFDERTGEAEPWTSNPGFLNGIAGVGLCLLAAVSPLEPAWDRTLLLSAPPRRDV